MVVRSKRPGSSGHHHTHAGQTDTKAEKGGKGAAKGKAAAAAAEKEATITQNGDNDDLSADNGDSLPKTFVMKDSYEYFKPKLHVEMDNPDKLDTVTELHIKGWKIEKPILEVLSLCLPHVDRLHTIK